MYIGAIPYKTIGERIDYVDTSLTSVPIGTGPKTITVTPGQKFLTDETLRLTDQTTAANRMYGKVTSYDAITGALTVNVLNVEGSGTPTAWYVSRVAQDNALLDNTGRATTLDAWHRQMVYAVTKQMTLPNQSFDPVPGAIAVVTETGTHLVDDPQGSAFWVILSRGANGIGAYNNEGKMVIPCAGISKDVDNCDVPAIDISFVNGIMSLVPGPDYFDDFVYVSTNKIKGLWTRAQNGAANITARNPGSVGINTSTPAEKLDVVGNIEATETHADELCDETGGDCFDPTKLGGPVGMVCPTSGPGTVNVMSGIANRDVIKTDPLTHVSTTGCEPVNTPTATMVAACPPGEALSGVNTRGCAICSGGGMICDAVCGPFHGLAFWMASPPSLGSYLNRCAQGRPSGVGGGGASQFTWTCTGAPGAMPIAPPGLSESCFAGVHGQCGSTSAPPSCTGGIVNNPVSTPVYVSCGCPLSCSSCYSHTDHTWNCLGVAPLGTDAMGCTSITF